MYIYIVYTTSVHTKAKFRGYSCTKQNPLLEGNVHISFLHQVLQPDVDITLSRTAPLHTGGNLTLTCTVTLDPNVDTDVMVVTKWSGPGDISGERYSTIPASGSGTTYTSSLTISHITDQDDGIYTCTCNVTATGRSNTQLATASDDTEIIVMGE